jgi:MFS family permease
VGVRDDGGYGAVLGERPIRRLLFASLSGRVAFAMLPLGLVIFGSAETGSTTTAGALIAAFAAASALAPARGRIVDRHGPAALAGFALACAAAVLALVAAASLGASRPVLVLLAGLAGLFAPPLGPFTRSVWGLALRDREQRLQRAYALDSAGEEAALIVSPLAVAAAIALASPRAALVVAAVGLLAGTIAAGRSRLAADLAPTAAPPPGRSPRLPAVLWLMFASLVPTAAALGAVDVAVPAAAREHGSATAAGVLLAAMAAGTVSGSLIAGRRDWHWAPGSRVVALQIVMSLGLALTAAVATELWLLGAALVVPGAALGALFASLYLLVDRLAPEGSGTRTFAWLVTANNGGLAIGAAVAGALSDGAGPEFGLWFGAVCALGGVIPATVALVVSAREPERPPVTRVR